MMKKLEDNKKEFVSYLCEKLKEISEYYEEDIPENLMLFKQRIQIINESKDFMWLQIYDSIEDLKWEKEQYYYKAATTLIKSL